MANMLNLEMPIWTIPDSSPHAGRIGIGLTATHLNRIKALPGSRYSKADEVWSVTRTYPSALALGGLARQIKHKVKPSEDLAAWVAAERKDWDTLRALSEKPMVAGEQKPGELFRHQRADIDWLTFPGGPKGRLLFNEMGTGKTRSVVYGMHDVSDGQPTLIVCPKTVAVTGWVAEIEDAWPNSRIGIALGTAPQRRKVFDAAQEGAYDVVVTGYEVMKMHTRYAQYGSIALKRCGKCGGPKVEDDADFTPEAKCQAHPRELNQIQWGLIVADEVHRALNATTATRMALAGLVRAAGPIPRWGLTGTPISKRPDGLWSLLNFVDEEGWPVKSNWVSRFCTMGLDNSGFLRVTGYNPETSKELHTALDAVSRRVLKAQVLDLPPMLRGKSLVREVEMGTEQRKAYNEMRDELVTHVKEGTITAANAMVQSGRLTLLASATGIPGPEKGSMLLRMPSCKIEELALMIENEELGDSYALAFTSRRFLRLTLDELVRRELLAEDQIGVIDGATKDADRIAAVENFQAGKIPCVLYTHAAGGVGITLHRADSLVLMERSWNPILMTQSLARVHRAGMPDRPVNVRDIITKATVERKQVRRNKEDAATLEEVVKDKERMIKFLMDG